MAQSIFDAKTCLQQLDPDIAYSCKPLTGGVVNVTIRAVKESEFVDKGRFPGRNSLILKHAPPYIAGRGEDAPMTQYRQTIEADALSLFSTALTEIQPASHVSIPDVLHHDSEEHVLILTDLGQLPNLSDIFTDLGGHSIRYEADHFDHSLFSSNDHTLTADRIGFLQDIGSRLGQFFARLHCPETRRKVLAEYPQRHFEVPEIHSVVLELAIKPLASQLKLFPDLIINDEADKLGRLLIEDFVRETPENEQSFTLGDCWPAAILVSSTSTSTLPDDSIVGVIDWEFAGFGRGPHGDMAQFLAHLELLRTVAQKHSRFRKHLQALDLLIEALTSAYSSTRSSNTSTENTSKHHFPRPDPLSLQARTLRSAFLAYGAELINATFWKKWLCLSPECPSSRTSTGDHLETEQSCILVQEMVKRGIWFLRHAREDVELFCEESNWREITEEALKIWGEGRRWLIDLF